ncbi:hypothetical protein HMPREF9318_00495 [Streptococcus urinalis FB127-CNA-2]|uniref:Membrane protein n=2 Tax=Streptococcus urinalis TaxID=149016 RepID=G5KG87_9STRE|nr:putative membrane protein [Streptococcus urinalis 2285-97]EKS22297.1 hypothetical protein HMPREF9318_00495 [Streptococcus urinalis FB127-CNA-2]VEF32109.1 integral membrane protein [Streptococcus urinalis]
MKKNKASNVAILSIFIAIMVVIHVVSNLVFSFLPVPIKPTLLQIPVIIASIMYGPKIGSLLGGFMGIISVINSSIVLLPTSYLFSPFVENGNFYSLIVAIVPRILIGIIPFYSYKLISNKFGLLISGAIGSLTNTVFVLSGIFIFFSSVYGGDIKLLLTGIISTNAIAEMIIASLVTVMVIPALKKIR